LLFLTNYHKFRNIEIFSIEITYFHHYNSFIQMIGCSGDFEHGNATINMTKNLCIMIERFIAMSDGPGFYANDSKILSMRTR